MDDKRPATSSHSKRAKASKPSSQGNFRVDGAHTLPAPDSVDASQEPADSEMFAGMIPQDAPDSLRRHLEQLIHHIQQKNQKLEHRENQLHTHLAEFETDIRSAKLSLEEREQAISDREQKIVASESKMKGQASEHASETQTLEKQRKKIVKAQAALIKEECRLSDEQKAINQTKADLEKQCLVQSRQLVAQEQKQLAEIEARNQILRQYEMQLEQRNQAITDKKRKWQTEVVPQKLWEETQAVRTALDQRSRLLSTSEQLLEKEWKVIREQKRVLQNDQELWEQKLLLQKSELEQMKSNCFEEMGAKKQALDSLTKRSDLREQTLNQMHKEIKSKHRSILEDRLVIEQLWTELQTHQSPAQLTLDLALTRNRLIQAYREVAQVSETQQQELIALRESLSNQQLALQSELERTRNWVQAQHQELESQAARLVAKENELSIEKESLSVLAAQCDKQRNRHRLEKRELLSEFELLLTKSA